VGKNRISVNYSNGAGKKGLYLPGKIIFPARKKNLAKPEKFFS